MRRTHYHPLRGVEALEIRRFGGIRNVGGWRFVAGSISGNSVVLSGAGIDSLSTGAETSIGGGVYISLGDGDNTTHIEGHVTRSVAVASGNGNDNLGLGEQTERNRRRGCSGNPPAVEIHK